MRILKNIVEIWTGDRKIKKAYYKRKANNEKNDKAKLKRLCLNVIKAFVLVESFNDKNVNSDLMLAGFDIELE